MDLKIITLFLLTTASANLFADCMGLKEGEVFRLDSPGKALNNSRVQDQDGLGSCYANTASVLLQANLPNNPNISYTNLALFFAQSENRLQSEGRFAKTVDEEDDTNLLDGGFTCDTINNVVKKQISSNENIVCKTEDVALEHSFFNKSLNAYEDPAYTQGDSILSASKYLTAYSQAFGADLTTDAKIAKRKEADEFARRIQVLVAENQQAAVVKECATPKMQDVELAISNGILKAITKYPGCLLNNKINSALAECKMFSDLGELYFDEGTKQLDFFISPALSALMHTMPETIFQKGISNDQYRSNINRLIKDNIKSTIPEALKDKFVSNMNESLSDYDKKKLNAEFDKVVLGKTAECVRDNQLAYFYNSENFLADAKSDNFLCQYENLLETIPNLAMSSTGSLLNNTNNLLKFLLFKGDDLKYDRNIQNLIANDCSEDKRIKLPETLKCKDFFTELTPEQANNKDFMTIFRESHRQEIFKTLHANQPLAIDFCTRMWNDPGFRLHANPKDKKISLCQDSGKHGIHATAMIGYRCKNNKLQYLAQNSWGPNWKLDNNHFEIENGKIWMDENELFDNLLNYSSISK